MAAKGATLVLNYASESSGVLTTKLAETCKAEHGVECLVVQADLGELSGPGQLVAATKKHFEDPKTGKFQIDIIINNAGIAINQLIQDVTIEAYDQTYRINVLGPLLLMQETLPYLPHDRSGRIVNLSSVSSSLGFAQQTVYGGTKAAMEAMTRTWARELAERTTVNAVNPGPVRTDMWKRTTEEFKGTFRGLLELTPLSKARTGIDDADMLRDGEIAGGRPAYPSEIAGIVAMLCSEDSAWCTGQVVCANGGMRMLM